MNSFIRNCASSVILFFIVAGCVLITGCNGKNAVSQNKKNVTKITPKTYTFYSAELTEPQPFTDEVAAEITRLTGVKLEVLIPRADYRDAVELMLASREFPDLIYAKGELSKLIEAGAVIPLDDYIEKYGANIKKLYGNQIVKLRNSYDDPSIYTVGTFEVYKNHTDVSGNMQLQNAVLRELGFPAIKTLDDYADAILAYKKKNPQINGHPTIGFSLLTDSWYWYLSLSNPGNYVIGLPDDGQWVVNQEDFSVTYKFLYPGMDVYYKWLNRLYHDGLLDPESFTQNYDVWLSKMTGGYVLGTTYPHWELTKIRTSLIQNGMENRIYAYLPVTASPEYKDPSLKDYGYSGGWGIAISSECKDPVGAFKFLDWFCTEEAQILVNWGIEGKHYYLDSDGNRTAFENLDDDVTGVGKWIYPFPQAGTGYLDSSGRYLGTVQVESIVRQYTRAEKEALDAYGVQMWTDLFPTSRELGVSRHGQVWQYSLSNAMSELVSQADEYVYRCLVDMITGPAGDFDNAWKNMQNELRKMKIEEAGDSIALLIQEKIKLWN